MGGTLALSRGYGGQSSGRRMQLASGGQHVCPTGSAAAAPVQPPNPGRCACLECRLGGGHLVLALALFVCRQRSRGTEGYHSKAKSWQRGPAVSQQLARLLTSRSLHGQRLWRHTLSRPHSCLPATAVLLPAEPQNSGPPRVHIPHTTHCPSRLSSELGLTGQRLGRVAGGGCRVS